MISKLFITLILTLPLLASANEYSEPDTLLTAASAKSLSIVSYQSCVSITIKNIDYGADNFYYSLDNKQCVSKATSRTNINYSNIKNPVITETCTGVVVDFETEGEHHSLNFPYSDPQNRQTKSYRGSNGSDFGFVLSRNNDTNWELTSGGFGLGWVTPMSSSEPMDISMGRSYELSWLYVLGVRMQHKAHSLTMGVGLDWRNIVTKGDMFKRIEGGRIERLQYDDGASNVRSRIKVFSLQLPVFYGLNFGHKRDFGVRIGPVVCFNTSSSIKTQYELNGDKYSIKTGNVGQRPVTVDGFFSISYDFIGLYVRYSPMKMMRNRTGLDYSLFSTGLMIGF